MNEVGIDFKEGNEGELPLVESGMRYGEFRHVEDQVVEEENVEVYRPGPKVQSSFSPHQLLRAVEPGEKPRGRAVPLDLYHGVYKIILGDG